jgi:3-phenylpropionate/trans-cinnamate dioxygenase ferredoxin reductase subunit
VPNFGDEIQLTQGSVSGRSFVAAYGREGRLVGAVTVDGAKWLDHYRLQIEQARPMPTTLHALDGPAIEAPVPAQFPHPSVPYHLPPVVLTGHAPHEGHAEMIRSPGGTS